MRRREFIALLGSGAAWPIMASAQQGSMPVVGILSGQSQEFEAALLTEWRKGLDETGYVGGRNVLFEYRFADGQNDRLRRWRPTWFGVRMSAFGSKADMTFCGANVCL
jgi:putative ABC transport system substrate-binding protein